MAKFQYKTKNNSLSIYYRATNGRNGIDVTKTLPIKLNDDDKWNNRLQSTENNLDLNKELLTFKNHLLSSLNKAITAHLRIDKKLINELHSNYFNPPKIESKETPTLLNYIKDFKRNYENVSTVKKLGAVISRVKNYSPNVEVSCVDINWINNYSTFMKSLNYSPSSINKDIQLIKQILRHADNNDINITRNVFNSKSLKTSTITHYLNENELELVFNFKTSNKALENTRRLFLIGATTGLRVSDLMKIKTFNIANGMIELTTIKTSQNIIIPINPRVKDFIEEVKPLAHPVFNRNLKKLFKAIGLNEITKGYIKGKDNKRLLGMYPKHLLLASHSMRRTFATNLYGKLPTMVIMAITGHTTEKSFLTYIKKPQRDFAERLKEYYLEKNAEERHIA
jgi:integrase